MTALLTALALVAFAANSILTRMALGAGAMDAATFTTVRLVAGAVVLATIVRVQGGPSPLRGGRSLVGPVALFAYAAPFSFAYVRIGAAAGALLLFGAVQITMIGWGIAKGERPGPRTWAGIALALAGLAWLTLPALGRPDPVGCGLMIVAGCAWGVYSLAGKRETNALAANARSFVWAVPLALLLNLVAASSVVVSGRGVILAAASGGITSGLGYAIWYRALRGLTDSCRTTTAPTAAITGTASCRIAARVAVSPRSARYQIA